MIRVIFDTLLLSGLLIPHEPPAKLLETWEKRQFSLIACDELITEFRAVSERTFFKNRLRRSAVEEMAFHLEAFSITVGALPESGFDPDPKDSYLLGMAEAGNADYLVTGDKALQRLRKHRSTRIVSPL